MQTCDHRIILSDQFREARSRFRIAVTSETQGDSVASQRQWVGNRRLCYGVISYQNQLVLPARRLLGGCLGTMVGPAQPCVRLIIVSQLGTSAVLDDAS